MNHSWLEKFHLVHLLYNRKGKCGSSTTDSGFYAALCFLYCLHHCTWTPTDVSEVFATGRSELDVRICLWVDISRVQPIIMTNIHHNYIVMYIVFYILYFISANPQILIYLPPFGNHKFVFYVCESISVL